MLSRPIYVRLTGVFCEQQLVLKFFCNCWCWCEVFLSLPLHWKICLSERVSQLRPNLPDCGSEKKVTNGSSI